MSYCYESFKVTHNVDNYGIIFVYYRGLKTQNNAEYKKNMWLQIL